MLALTSLLFLDVSFLVRLEKAISLASHTLRPTDLRAGMWGEGSFGIEVEMCR